MNASRTIAVACCQLAPKIGDLAHNRRITERAIRAAALQGARVVVLPELVQSGYVFHNLGEALALAERGSFRLEQGAAHRALAMALATLGERQQADREFRESLEILEAIQSRPEVAQTLLAHGRFLADQDPAAGRALIERALSLFEKMNATGWIAEARRALVPQQ